MTLAGAVTLWVRIVLVAVLGVAVLWAVHAGMPLDLSERGGLETWQAAILAATALIWARVAWQARAALRPRDVSAALLLVAVAAAGAARELGFGREIGFGPMQVGLAKVLVAVMASGLAGAAVLSVVLRPAERAGILRAAARAETSVYLMAAVTLFLAAEAAEAALFASAARVLVEEALELGVYATLFAAGARAMPVRDTAVSGRSAGLPPRTRVLPRRRKASRTAAGGVRPAMRARAAARRRQRRARSR